MKEYLLYNQTLDYEEQIQFFATLEEAREHKTTELNWLKHLLKYEEERQENQYKIEKFKRDIKDYDKLAIIYELREVK